MVVGYKQRSLWFAIWYDTDMEKIPTTFDSVEAPEIGLDDEARRALRGVLDKIGVALNHDEPNG